MAWHNSLQHEAIHGHPSSSRRLNTAIAAWPLSLWLPYAFYRESHLAHHDATALTTPGDDPESHYRAPPQGLVSHVEHRLAVAGSSLLGRLTIGPILLVIRFGATELTALRHKPRRGATWAEHATLTLPVLGWLHLVCHMDLADYLLTFVYPGAALTLLRSFVEHRADEEPGRRVAVVERAPLLGLLFLHNNLHALHHRRPGLAWYRLPGVYRRQRAALLRANGGLVYAGYSEVFARFLLRPHDRLIHPSFEQSGGP